MNVNDEHDDRTPGTEHNETEHGQLRYQTPEIDNTGTKYKQIHPI